MERVSEAWGEPTGALSSTGAFKRKGIANIRNFDRITHRMGTSSRQEEGDRNEEYVCFIHTERESKTAARK